MFKKYIVIPVPGHGFSGVFWYRKADNLQVQDGRNDNTLWCLVNAWDNVAMLRGELHKVSKDIQPHEDGGVVAARTFAETLNCAFDKVRGIVRETSAEITQISTTSRNSSKLKITLLDN